jgi:polyhydroxyalkanoate synthesis regulator phasin
MATKGKKSTSTSKSSASVRGDKSIEAFRDALEKSVTLSRDRLQEVVDDAVKRGRITRGDANELVSNLVTRGRSYTDDLIKDLEKLLEQARKELDSRVSPARKRAEKATSRAGKRVRDAAEPALAQADKLRRRAGVGSSPITGYDNLTATQVKTRLKDLTAADLRKVRTQEKAGKARKSILEAVDKQLAK